MVNIWFLSPLGHPDPNGDQPLFIKIKMGKDIKLCDIVDILKNN